MNNSTRFIGLDDSKDAIQVAIAEEGRGGEVREYGAIPNTPDAIRKLVRRLGRPKDLNFVYEAGPCGYVTCRELRSLGLARFDRARDLMGFVGLVPSLDATGLKHRTGAITKTGNGHARRVLIEAAWSYRHPARRTAHLKRRLDVQPEEIQQIAWKAQLRLCGRYRKLTARKKHQNKVIVALARELVGFLWVTAKMVATN